MITVVDYTNNGKKANRRPDVLLYVNGIRKLLIEGMTTEIDDTLCRGDEWERIAVYVKLRTLDLNGDFISIKKQLDEIAEKYLLENVVWYSCMRARKKEQKSI